MSQPTLVGCLWHGPCQNYDRQILVTLVVLVLIIIILSLYHEYSGKKACAPEQLEWTTRVVFLALFFLAFGLRGILVYLALLFLLVIIVVLFSALCGNGCSVRREGSTIVVKKD